MKKLRFKFCVQALPVRMLTADAGEFKEGEHPRAGKHSTAEVIDVLPDGSWSYRDSTPENPAAHTIAVGMSAIFLKYFFFNPKMYLDAQTL